MQRKHPTTGRLQILVDTPMGQVWQYADAPRPPIPNNPYARYSPTGRQPYVSASDYRSPMPASEKAYENLFDPEFASLIPDAFKDTTKPIRSAVKVGKGSAKKSVDSSYPVYETPLYLKKLKGGGR